MAASQAEAKPLRSLNHDEHAYVTFINRTPKPVDLIWLDYHGRCKRYENAMAPGGRKFINTYVTHPWRAWESGTEEECTIGGNTTYYPVAWQGERSRTEVYIDLPVESLLKLCYRKVRSLVQAEDVEGLEIPHNLFDDLKLRRRTSVVDVP